MDIHCQWSTTFWSPHRHIVLGDHVGIGPRCTFLCDIEIGNKVLIASNVGLLGSDDHRYDIVGKAMWDSGRGDRHKIKIEDDVWIGFNATILKGVTIGKGAVIGACSVVTKDVLPYKVVVGNPARDVGSSKE